jgi:hypothetical protein
VIQPSTNEVTVRIDVPINENSWVAPFFFKDMSVSTSMTMRRERFGTHGSVIPLSSQKNAIAGRPRRPGERFCVGLRLLR